MAGRGGWYGEPKRHSLAAKGILTTRKPSDIAKPVYPSLPKARYATALVRDFDSGEGKQGYAQIPDFLYHGTSAKNINQIFKEGIKSNLDPTDWTVEDKHVDDSYNNVSMARDLKDAVMFSIGSTGWTGDQAIFKIDTSKLEDRYLFARPLFGKNANEWKYFTETGIPPEAIKSVLVRRFTKDPVKGLQVTEEEIYRQQEAN